MTTVDPLPVFLKHFTCWSFIDESNETFADLDKDVTGNLRIGCVIRQRGCCWDLSKLENRCATLYSYANSTLSLFRQVHLPAAITNYTRIWTIHSQLKESNGSTNSNLSLHSQMNENQWKHKLHSFPDQHLHHSLYPLTQSLQHKQASSSITRRRTIRKEIQLVFSIF